MLRLKDKWSIYINKIDLLLRTYNLCKRVLNKVQNQMNMEWYVGHKNSIPSLHGRYASSSSNHCIICKFNTHTTDEWWILTRKNSFMFKLFLFITLCSTWNITFQRQTQPLNLCNGAYRLDNWHCYFSHTNGKYTTITFKCKRCWNSDAA